MKAQKLSTSKSPTNAGSNEYKRNLGKINNAPQNYIDETI